MIVMNKILIENYLKGNSQEGKLFVEKLFKEVDILYMQSSRNKVMVKQQLQSKYDFIDDHLFELIFLTATMFVH